uniref:CUB domain-containing protein n=1 Tax=Glossina austeni TaxID=7395 RepID=A0A1A9UPM5_GLOAU
MFRLMVNVNGSHSLYPFPDICRDLALINFDLEMSTQANEAEKIFANNLMQWNESEIRQKYTSDISKGEEEKETNEISLKRTDRPHFTTSQRIKRSRIRSEISIYNSGLRGSSSSSSSSSSTHLHTSPTYVSKFALTSFGSPDYTDYQRKSPPNAFPVFKAQSSTSSLLGVKASPRVCGGVLNSRNGVIQTPNFPHKFSTPIECVWIIDASNAVKDSFHRNASIVVYLTQLYVLSGLKFTEYMYYSDDYKVPAHSVFTLTEGDITKVAWIQFNSQYLEISFQMSSLDGTHLRALDRLLDVYGFNITYEMAPLKPYQCSALQCRFLGHCYAHHDFRHIGDAAITCHCLPGYKGTRCEVPEISERTMAHIIVHAFRALVVLIVAMVLYAMILTPISAKMVAYASCTTNLSALTCHRQCDFENLQEKISVSKANKFIARAGKTRYEATIRSGTNLTNFYQHHGNEKEFNQSVQHFSQFLEKHVSESIFTFSKLQKAHDDDVLQNFYTRDKKEQLFTQQIPKSDQM